jgi:hypothetical protein
MLPYLVFILNSRSLLISGAHPASYPLGTRGPSLEVKRPGREADSSHPSNAEDKNVWSYTSTPPIRLDGVVFS